MVGWGVQQLRGSSRSVRAAVVMDRAHTPGSSVVWGGACHSSP